MRLNRSRVGLLATHPIQYYVPWYRELSKVVDLQVFYCHRQTPEGQGGAGFKVAFDWDVPLLDGYRWQFLKNISRRADVSTFSGCDTPEIADVIYRERFDAFIVHGWALKSYWQAIIACWRQRTPVLVRGDSQLLLSSSAWWQLAKWPIYRLFIPRFDAYLVVGERARQYLLHYGAPAGKMFLSPHSVDNHFFSVSADSFRGCRDSLRNEWGLPAGATVFLFAAKFIEKKRPWDFVRAIAQASAVQEGIWGLMVGDGPLRSDLEMKVRNESWPIRFAGFLNQTAMPKAYAASDALVLPSNGDETWGLVVNEAMAGGIPAIVSDQAGCSADLVHPGKTGEIFKGGSVDELSGILTKLAADPRTLPNLGSQARQHIQRYSLSQAVAGAEAAIHSITSLRRLANASSLAKGC
jgi:glycosyltransferase involved in cell wall biosynthesis